MFASWWPPSPPPWSWPWPPWSPLICGLLEVGLPQLDDHVVAAVPPQVGGAEPDRVHRLGHQRAAHGRIRELPVTVQANDLTAVPADVPRHPGVPVRVAGPGPDLAADREPSHRRRPGGPSPAPGS